MMSDMRLRFGLSVTFFAALFLTLLLSLSWSTAIAADENVQASVETLVRERLDGFLKQRASSRVNRTEVPSLGSFALKGVNPNELQIDLRTRVTGKLSGRVPVTVVMSSRGEELKRGVVTVQLKTMSNVLVATRSLNRGQVIGDGDFRSERRDLSVFRDPVVTRVSQLHGKRMRRSIGAGRVWQPRHLEVIPTVKRGEFVRLRLESGGLRIDGRGKANEDGGVGDVIRVLNSASNRFVSGQIDAEGNVHVHF